MLASLLLAGWALLLGVTAAPESVCPLYPSEHERLGVNVMTNYGKAVDDYDVAQLHAGWYVDYAIQLAPAKPAGLAYVQTLLPSLHYPIRPDVLGPYVDDNPGAVWVVGNEPDRDLQDGLTPDAYAVFYHDLRAFIKGRDPSAQIAIAGLVQPTPIRLRYLDAALAAYKQRYGERFPVDIWTMHGFILNEELDGWGAGIPVGLEAYAYEGMRYTVRDHGRMDLFQQQIIEFRKWMASRGYRDKPLIISEYGILLPDLYGYTDPVVGNFMAESFHFMQTAADPATGYPRDGNRLVQSWAWYSLNDHKYDVQTGIGFNGNLFDHDSGQITPVGNRFAAYTAPLVDMHSNVAITAAAFEPSMPITAGITSAVTVTAAIFNGGNLAAEGVRLHVYRGDPDQGGVLVAQSPPAAVSSHCTAELRLSAAFAVRDWGPGVYPLTLVVQVQNPQQEKTLEDNRVETSVWILREGQTLERTHIPFLARGAN